MIERQMPNLGDLTLGGLIPINEVEVPYVAIQTFKGKTRI